MSYSSIGKCIADSAFVSRVSACLTQEQIARGDPIDPTPLSQVVWQTACASDVEAAYETALVGEHGNPGGSEAVITDGMILSNVQAHYPVPPA